MLSIAQLGRSTPEAARDSSGRRPSEPSFSFSLLLLPTCSCSLLLLLLLAPLLCCSHSSCPWSSSFSCSYREHSWERLTISLTAILLLGRRRVLEGPELSATSHALAAAHTLITSPAHSSASDCTRSVCGGWR